MKSTARKSCSPLLATLLTAAALGVAGCDQKPATNAESPRPPSAAPDSTARQGEQAASAGKPAESRTIAKPGDAALATKVKAAIVAEPGIKVKEIEVNAADGVVTLVGTVDSAADGHQAALRAMNVEGVRSVKNDLQVVPGA